MSHAEQPLRLSGMEVKRDPDVLDMPLRALVMSNRLYNALTNGAGITTVREVVAMSAREVLRLPGLGRLSQKELICELANYGLELAPDPYYMQPAATPVAPPTIYDRLREIEARLDAIERR